MDSSLERQGVLEEDHPHDIEANVWPPATDANVVVLDLVVPCPATSRRSSYFNVNK
jgi:hypothetical protein